MHNDIVEGFRLSVQQKRLWRLQSHGAAYTAQIALLLEGDLQIALLRAALQQLVDRYDVLRMTFHALPGMSIPIQVVADQVELDWQARDLRDERADQQQVALDQLLADAASQPFDVAQAPPLRATLATLSPTRHVLALTLPTLCADSWTLDLLMRLLSRAYADGAALSPADEPIQYVSFAEWQHELLASDEVEIAAARQYWQQQSLDTLPLAQLPFERQRANGHLAAPAALTLQLDRAETEQIASLAQRADSTAEAVLLACWQVLLWRLTGQSQLAVGALSSGRAFEELHESLGLFAQHLPIVGQLAPGQSFSAVLAQTGGALEDARAWQAGFVPDEQAEPSAAPRFAFGFEHLDLSARYSAGDVVFSRYGHSCVSEPFNVSLCSVATPDGLTLTLRYDPELFEAATIEPLAGYFAVLLRHALAAPATPIERLELLSAAERQRLLHDFGTTAALPADERTVVQLFEAQAIEMAYATAVSFEEQQLSYEQLNHAANQLAHHLRGLGVGPEVCVGLYPEHSAELLIGVLGILKAGGAYVPLDPSYPAERLQFMLHDAQAAVLLTQQRLLDGLGQLDERIEVVCLDRDWSLIAEQPLSNPPALAGPDNLAYVIYTSGSTGRPKGTLVPHRGLSNYLRFAVERYDVAGGEGAPVHSSVAFDLTITGLFAPLLVGQRVVLAQRTTGIEALSSLLHNEADLSFVKLTPAHVRLLSRKLKPEAAADRVRALIIGGEALMIEDVGFWREHAPETRLFNEYGPTETVVGCCVYELKPEDQRSHAFPIGRPIPGAQLYVLDAQMQPVPVGVAGELYIGGVGVARGYLGRPALTAEKFVPNPFAEQRTRNQEPGTGALWANQAPASSLRLYKTGDLARWLPDGNLEYLGRIDDQVKVRGFRIELGEIESVLQQHPAVRECAVLARSEASGEKRLVGYIAVQPGQAPTIIELRQFLQQQLPDYMLPSAFVVLPSLPLTANGKVDRRALPAPDQSRPELGGSFVAPLTMEEEILAGVWAQVLGLEQIGIDDNYFALGGDSIRSIQIVAQAQERGLHFTVDQLFDHPTIRALAQQIDDQQPAQIRPTQPFSMLSEADRLLVPDEIEDAYPLTMLQGGMIFHREFNPGSAIYHDISSFHLKAPFDPAMLTLALEQLIARHPALRTSFDLGRYSEPLQLVHREGSVALRIEDLTALTHAEQERALSDWFEAEKERGFDTARLPLIRFLVHLRSAESFQFTVSFHHAILDGWSEASMLTELFHHYLAMVKGSPLPATPPAATFRDFVALERDALASEASQRYWTEKLDGSSFMHVPRWRAPEQRDRTTRDIIVVQVPVSDEVSEGIKRLALSCAVPIKDVLLAAHMRVLSLLSGQTDILTGLVSAGRAEGLDGDKVLGLFINSMPFRLQLPGGSWTDLVTQTFQAERESLQHRRYPMAEIKRQQGGQPLAETLFYFTHYHVYQSLQRVPDLAVLDGFLYEETSFALAANFRVDPFTSHVHINLKCDGTQFSAEQVDALSGYYGQVLTAMASSPSARYETENLLTSEERQKLLIAWSGQAEQQPAAEQVALHTLFERQAAGSPQAVAVCFEDERLSYRELNERANQLAHHLRGLGVGPDVVVGLAVERSLDLVVGILGILKAGGAYLPLDPAYPHERLQFMLEDAQAPMLLTQQAHLATFDPARTGHSAQVLALDADWPTIAAQPRHNPAPLTAPDHLAYIIYTSGSTGQPKGTLIAHRNVVRLFAATEDWYHFGPEDVWTLFHSYAFDFSVWELWGALLYGGRLVVVPYLVTRSPEAFYELLSRERVTVLNQTPSAFRQLIQAEQSAEQRRDLRLRLVIFGGEALDFASLRPWFERHGDQQPQLVNMYGITETTVHVTYRPLSIADLDGAASSIGVPIPDLRVYVLDHHLQPAPIGVPGELHVGGAGLAHGYLNRPQLTAERFIPNPFASDEQARLYKTGDLARWLPDGNLEYLGRIDDQVKLRGFRIELGEIESALQQHPAVQEAVVMAREDRPGDKRLVAYVVGAEPRTENQEPGSGTGGSQFAQGAPVLGSELRQFLAQRLPDYMIPAAFMVLDALPLTPSGKLDRRALPVPEALRPELSTSYTAPTSAAEEVLAGIWSQVLGVEQIGIHDNFFELGGHSLLATQVVGMVRDAFQRNIPLRTLFQAPTIAAFGRAIQQSAAEQGHDAERYIALPILEPDRAGRYQPFPLTDIQQAYWVGRNQGFELGNTPAHIYLEFDGVGLELPRIQTAVQRLIARHDMLRAIVRDDGQQQILEHVPDYQIETLDLRGLPPEQAEAAIERTRAEVSHRMFQTDQWPLFEIKAHLLDDDHIRLFFGIDLLITDADSLGILNREIGRLYLDPDAALPQLDISFRDYVLAEIALHDSEIYRRSRDYWIKRLDRLPPAPELQMAAAAISDTRFTRLRGGLDPQSWNRLKARAARAGVTPSGILLAAYAEVLGLWSKSPQFSINVTTYNCLPLHPQAQHLIGDFTALTLLAVDGAQPTFEARAKAVQQQFLDDLDHNHFSAIQIMRELSRSRGSLQQAAMPIVFTSTLPLHTREIYRPTPIPAELVMGITQSPQTLIDHQVSEEDGALTIRWDYMAEAFPAGMVDDMFAAYSGLLQQLVASEAAWHSATRTALLPAHQRATRAAVNATAAPRADALLHTLVAARAAQQPDQPAIIAPDRTLSYAQLQRASTALATTLRQHGAQPNTLVALLLPKGWPQLVAALAVLEAGAAYLPLDPDLPPQRRAALLDQAQVTLVLTTPALRAELAWPVGLTPLPVEDTLLAAPAAAPLTPVQTPADLAYVIFTSGSTGTPKGVMLDHRAVVNTLLDLNQRFGITPDDRVLALSALTFDLSVYDLFGVLAAGGTVVLPAPERRRDPAHWLQLLHAHRVTLWNTVPALLDMLVTYVSGQAGTLPATLRQAWLSGDWIPLTLPGRAWALQPTLQLHSLGGATEAAIWSIGTPITHVDPAWTSIPYGRPLANQWFAVLNARGEPCPDWVPGQLVIGGAGLAQGYWRAGATTAAQFVPDHLSGATGGRLYRTGDLGRYWPDGTIEFLGRADDQVKVQGHRIELGEIEATLAQHPQVRAAVVQALGERHGPKRLVGYVVSDVPQLSASAPQPAVAPGQVLLDPAEREAFKHAQPGLRQLSPSAPTIALSTTNGRDLVQDYVARRTYYEFRAEPIPFEHLSKLLSSLRQMWLRDKPKYRYGSAGGLYPVQVYLHLNQGAVEGIPAGAYYYHPVEHRLIALGSTSRLDETIHWPANRATFKQAAFSIFLIGQLEAIAPMYGQAARDFCFLEAGLITQLLEITATEASLGLCQIGGLDFERLKPVFDLQDSHILLHSLVGGAVAPTQISADELRYGSAQPLAAPAHGGVSQADATAHSEELRSFLRQRLPEYMVPPTIILLNELPLSSNGKVNRAALPLPESLSEPTTAEFVAPRSELEQTIAACLQQEIAVERVGLHDNFFDLGANSLTLVKVHRHLQEALQQPLPIVALFNHPTIAALAEHLRPGAPQPGTTQEDEERIQKQRQARQRRALLNRSQD